MVLVQYGRLGFLADAGAVCGFARGDQLVIRTGRGVELGTVLNPESRVPNPESCSYIRPATPIDLAAAGQNDAVGQTLLEAAESAGLPIAFIDVEVNLDRTGAVLHALPYDACDASNVLASLSDRFGLSVRLLDLSRDKHAPDPPDPEKMTCGKPDCGTGSGCSSCSTGGCSTGSCSKGKVKSAEELTSFFADLRRKMPLA